MKVSRRQTFALGLGAGLSVTMLSGSDELAAAPANTTFTLLLVNDIYRLSDLNGRGGFAKLAAVVKAERARGVPMLFCHAGDTFSPSLISGFDQGASIVEVTNQIAPDVFVPGNHEFDFGKEVYFKRMSEAKFPFFAANMRQGDGTVIPGMCDTAVFTLGPVKVGVVGLAIATTPKMSQPGDLVFLPELETLRAEAAKLRAAGADFLVAVAHTARPVGNEIVRSGLVDVLLSGHNHDLAIEYDGKTVMVESSEEGNFVTAIDFTAQFKGEGKARKLIWQPSFRVHDSTTIDADPQMLALVAKFEAELAKDLDVEIGTTTTELDSRNTVVRSQEAAIGNLIADALRASTGADMAITNGGGIRGDKRYPAGKVLTRRDILTELPFGNTVVLVQIKGTDVLAALENGVSHLEERAGRFPQVSGLTFTIEPRAPVGARIGKVRVGDAPLDPAATYRVAATNFLLGGGDGYTSLANGKVLIGATDGRLLANEVMAYVRKLANVTSRVEGRITIL